MDKQTLITEYGISEQVAVDIENRSLYARVMVQVASQLWAALQCGRYVNFIQFPSKVDMDKQGEVYLSHVFRRIKEKGIYEYGVNMVYPKIYSGAEKLNSVFINYVGVAAEQKVFGYITDVNTQEIKNATQTIISYLDGGFDGTWISHSDLPLNDREKVILKIEESGRLMAFNAVDAYLEVILKTVDKFYNNEGGPSTQIPINSNSVEDVIDKILISSNSGNKVRGFNGLNSNVIS